MIEVEVKARVRNFDGIEKELTEIGATKIKKEHQEDVYFNAPHRDFAKTDEALRIRKTFQKKASKIILTYKGAKMDKISKTRKEIEVEIENVEKATLILENLGFSPVATIKKDRESYFLDGFIICLDNVHMVGNFVEIEKEAKEGDDFKTVVEEIFKIYEKLGVTEGFERRSYLEMLGIYI
ncbi:MAG: class IV adenylate cyclase [Euryarchaeota archaeon]|nr:class IV adenylate cyclase [Euryarchaeota archaeon]